LSDDERAKLVGETGRSSDGVARSQVLEKWILERTRNALNIETVSDEKIETLRRLRDALDRANRAVEDCGRANLENFRRLSVLCGDEVLEHIARGRRAAKESARLGFEIFAERLAALQLGEAKLRELWIGTAEHQKYVHALPSTPNLKIGWSDPTTGEARHYIEGTPGQLASWHQVFAARAAELEASAKAAAAELARTKKATGKAA
jgi:hypothetical protein